MPTNMKRIIAQQMLVMMRERSIDKITVKALIEACDISRQTFYYHFRDIMDVLEWILSQSMERMLQRSLKSGSPQEAMEIFIRETEENKDLIRKLLASSRRVELEAMFVKTLREYLEKMADQRRPDLVVSYADKEFLLDFWSYGLTGMLFKYSCSKEIPDAPGLTKRLGRLLLGELQK